MGCIIFVNFLYQALKMPAYYLSVRKLADEERAFYMRILISNLKIFQRTCIAYIFSLSELLHIC